MSDKVKNAAKSVIKKVESSLSTTSKVVIGSALVGTLAGLSYLALQPKGNITSPTVMVTNIVQNSGGSGVVISRSKNSSIVLTNSHVCEVVKNGGVVSNNAGQAAMVTKYAQSKLHDLCLVHVQEDLKVSAPLASAPPGLYEEATVSGHPNLLPNVLSKGHFSGKRVIQVLTGFRRCSAEDYEQGLGIFCAILGGIPVVKSYETVLVTAMIMPGSSGSAVYNANKEISGLVFAGTGGMSYAFIVPYEYIFEMIHSEELEYKVPSYVMSNEEMFSEESVATRLKTKMKQITSICTNVNITANAKTVCDAVVRDVNWRM